MSPPDRTVALTIPLPPQPAAGPASAGADASAGRAALVARSIEVGRFYWLTMFAASAVGTNLGDYWVAELSLGRPVSFLTLVLVCTLAIWRDAIVGRRTEAFYWIAIVALRAGATNAADFLTHDLGISYLLVTLIFAALTLAAGYATRPGAEKARSPLVDGRYWGAMLLAGMFGTIGGDLVSDAVGVYASAAVLGVVLLGALAVRGRLLPGALLAYWIAMMAERAAGTPFGDALAGDEGVHLGLPLALTVTLALFAGAMVMRGFSALMPAPTRG